MIIKDIFNIKKMGRVILGESKWEDEEFYNLKQIVVCKDKKYKVILINRIHQGCFSIPEKRMHGLVLEPIDHTDLPNIGDEIKGIDND